MVPRALAGQDVLRVVSWDVVGVSPVERVSLCVGENFKSPTLVVTRVGGLAIVLKFITGGVRIGLGGVANHELRN